MTCLRPTAFCSNENQLSTYHITQNFHFYGVQNDATIKDSLHNLFFVLSQKVLIAETRSNALSEDINRLLAIKTTLQQSKLILIMLRAILYLSISSSLSIFPSLFSLHA